MAKHIVVVGAGVVGLNVAHALLDEGHRVTILDKGEPGAQTSRGNAGCIAHTDILPLASPKVIWKVAGWLADPLGPLAIRPRHLPTLVPWLARFLLSSRPAAMERSTAGLIPLQALSMPAWQRRLASLGLERELNHHGFLYVWDDIAGFEASRAVYRRQRDLGIDVDLIESQPDVRALEPALSPRFVRAAHFPGVAHVNDPFELSTKLAAALRQRGGTFRAGGVDRVEAGPGGSGARIALTGGETVAADMAVIAAGAWSKPLARLLGDVVPLDSERGYNATMTDPGVAFTRPVLFEGHAFVITPLKTGLRVGGAVELASTEADPNWKRVEALLAKAKRFVPGLGEGGRQDWMGNRPSIPDSLPVIGRSRASADVLYAFGHSHHGLTQAAATAEIITALVAGRTPPIDAAPYSAQRF